MQTVDNNAYMVPFESTLDNRLDTLVDRFFLQGKSRTSLSSGKAAHVRNGVPVGAISKIPSRESLSNGKRQAGNQEALKPEVEPPPPASESEGEEGSETTSTSVAADIGSSTPPRLGEMESQLNSPSQAGEANNGAVEMHLRSSEGEAEVMTVVDSTEGEPMGPESVSERFSDSEREVEERKEMESEGEAVGVTEEEGNSGSDSHMDPGQGGVEGGGDAALAVQQELDEVRWGWRCLGALILIPSVDRRLTACFRRQRLRGRARRPDWHG